MNKDNPIGVFDSGIGGLTVLQKIIEVLPRENTVYLGDTARAPYGIKSTETVLRGVAFLRGFTNLPGINPLRTLWRHGSEANV